MQYPSDQQWALSMIIVMYRSSDVTADCLRSVVAQREYFRRIILVDNCCPEDSVTAAQRATEELGVDLQKASNTASADMDPDYVELIRSDRNLGFAGGVNLALDMLMNDRKTAFFWILNPDCELEQGSAKAMLTSARQADKGKGFSLLGSRILYQDEHQTIQSDGGICCTLTGRCRNLNQGKRVPQTIVADNRQIDFISGANMIASRKFVARAGRMPEDFFLYYEEVAWAQRRGELPLVWCHDAVIRHHGGTAIGSGAVGRTPSPLSNYFNFRSRMRFMACYHPRSLTVCYVFSILKIVQTILKGGWHSAIAAFCGLHDLPPPAKVRTFFSEAEQLDAFGPAFRGNPQVIAEDQHKPA